MKYEFQYCIFPPLKSEKFIPHLRLVLEVDGVPVALLQDAGVEVVPVVRAELPPSSIGVSHPVPSQPRGLDVPDGLGPPWAAGLDLVLVADLDGGRRDAVDALVKKGTS